MSTDEAKGASEAGKGATRSARVDVRVTSEESALIKRCAEHFNNGKSDAEVSLFLRNLVILYAIDHGLPLHDGEVAGSVGENEDARKLAVKKSKLDDGIKRLATRKGAE